MNKAASQTQDQTKPNPLQASGVLQRKCACGNRTVAGGECAECGKKEHSLQHQTSSQGKPNSDTSLSRTPAIQRKLTIGESDDPMEQEADRVADQVLSMPANPAIGSAPPRIQRFTEQPAGQTDTVPASVGRALASPGSSMEPMLRQDMELRFGHDFSRVRVHSDSAATQSVHEVNANAYTVGQNIVFGTGRFAPGAHEGRRLIAHELTHVVQQSGSEGMGSSQHNEQRSPSSILHHTHGLKTNSGTLLQRDLALEPTNPTPQEVNLTAGQIRDAIAFNRRRYDAENTRLIQDVVGGQQTGTFDEETIRLIARYQDDFGLTPADGKVGPDTFDQLTAELQAENVDDQTCLTMFNVSNPTPLAIRITGMGVVAIFSRFNVTARFSPHCNCDEFDYRQFICGSVDGTQSGALVNMNGNFFIPGGGLPQCPGWVEDGDTTASQNGRYGHRDHTARANNRYLDDTGTVDMANGCRFAAFDVPGVEVPANSGDRYDFNMRFFGDVRRSGRRMRRKFWAIRDNLTIP